MTKPLDYAYMFKDRNGADIARYDSAGHHNKKLEFAPDHFHYDLLSGNDLIRQSFLTGFLPLDLKGLRSAVELFEKSCS